MSAPPPTHPDRVPGLRSWAVDAGPVVALVATSLLLLYTPSPVLAKMVHSVGSERMWAQHVLWWLLASIPAVIALLIRRRWPILAFGLALASAAAHYADISMPLRLPMDAAVPITLYTVASLATSRRRGAAALGVGVLTTYVVMLGLQLNASSAMAVGKAGSVAAHNTAELALAALSDASAIMLVLCLAWAVGDNARNRLALADRRAADLVREHDQQTALATATERARITRELHDVVAHGLSVMVVQAEGGAAALRRHPDRTATALENIIATGHASLQEMSHLIGVVRDGSTEGPAFAPQPGVGALPALVDLVRAAGMPVRFTVDGQPGPLAAAVDLSAYRIVQEALTNTLKHAGPSAEATVRLAFELTTLDIEVTDTGRTAVGKDLAAKATNNGGNGLRGIAERVTMLGGHLRIGPTPSGGFQLHATLPLGASA
jgi:signal transduction histidine kinase